MTITCSFQVKGVVWPSIWAGQVRKTGQYLKEVVKNKVTDAAHNIKRGVNEGVSEVAEAVKVRACHTIVVYVVLFLLYFYDKVILRQNASAVLSGVFFFVGGNTRS